MDSHNPEEYIAIGYSRLQKNPVPNTTTQVGLGYPFEEQQLSLKVLAIPLAFAAAAMLSSSKVV